MNTANGGRLSVSTDCSQILIAIARRAPFWLEFCCQTKTDYIIIVQHRHEGFLK